MPYFEIGEGSEVAMLIAYDQSPIDTIYYVSACILKELQENAKDIDVLFSLIQRKFNPNLSYVSYLLAIDFLFLVDKLKLKGKDLIICL